MKNVILSEEVVKKSLITVILSGTKWSEESQLTGIIEILRHAFGVTQNDKLVEIPFFHNLEAKNLNESGT